MIPGVSRINVKIKEQQETDINGQGPVIPEEALEQLIQKLERSLHSEDVLVLAGSIPDSLPNDVYQQILKRLDGRGVRTVVDATGSLLTNVLIYRPFLIKPNHHELGRFLAKNCIPRRRSFPMPVSFRNRARAMYWYRWPATARFLLDEAGRVHHSPAPKGKVVNAVGAGDSMVAGFLYGYLTTKDYEKAFYWGLCAGSATAFHSDWPPAPI